MVHFTPMDEAESHRHTILPTPHDYSPFSYAVSIEQGIVSSVVIKLRGKLDDKHLNLRFHGITSSGDTIFDLTCLHHVRCVHVIDISYRQWDRSKVEVIGDDLDDYWVTMFWAESVEDDAI